MQDHESSREQVIAEVDGFPVLRPGQFAERDPFLAAWVLIPPALVEPVWRMVERLPSMLPGGEAARAVELLIIGLDEDDFTLVGSALDQLTRSLRALGRHRVLASVDELRALAQVEEKLARGEVNARQARKLLKLLQQEGD
jgi:hypothetical protein